MKLLEPQASLRKERGEIMPAGPGEELSEEKIKQKEQQTNNKNKNLIKRKQKEQK